MDDSEDKVFQYLKSSGHNHIIYEPDALNIIAQKSEGGLRDALSIFDMLASFTGNNITFQKAIENLNVLDYNYFIKLTNAFLQGDVVSSLLIFDEILKQGFDAHNFINGLSAHFRDLLVSKDEQTLVLLEVGDSIKLQYKDQSSKTPVDFLYKALEITNECDLYYKSSKNQRLHVELALIKLCGIAEEKKNEITKEYSEIETVQEEES